MERHKHAEDKVQKPIDSDCHRPSSEPFTDYLDRISSSQMIRIRYITRKATEVPRNAL
jgi:hypothetical protein